jgi:hypothetical protein
MRIGTPVVATGALGPTANSWRHLTVTCVEQTNRQSTYIPKYTLFFLCCFERQVATLWRTWARTATVIQSFRSRIRTCKINYIINQY